MLTITLSGVILCAEIYLGIALVYCLISSFINGLSSQVHTPNFLESVLWPFSICYMIGLFVRYFKISRTDKTKKPKKPKEQKEP